MRVNKNFSHLIAFGTLQVAVLLGFVFRLPMVASVGTAEVFKQFTLWSLVSSFSVVLSGGATNYARANYLMTNTLTKISIAQKRTSFVLLGISFTVILYGVIGEINLFFWSGAAMTFGYSILVSTSHLNGYVQASSKQDTDYVVRTFGVLASIAVVYALVSYHNLNQLSINFLMLVLSLSLLVPHFFSAVYSTYMVRKNIPLRSNNSYYGNRLHSIVFLLPPSLLYMGIVSLLAMNEESMRVSGITVSIKFAEIGTLLSISRLSLIRNQTLKLRLTSERLKKIILKEIIITLIASLAVYFFLEKFVTEFLNSVVTFSSLEFLFAVGLNILLLAYSLASSSFSLDHFSQKLVSKALFIAAVLGTATHLSFARFDVYVSVILLAWVIPLSGFLEMWRINRKEMR